MLKDFCFAAVVAVFALTGCNEKNVELDETAAGDSADKIQLTVRVPESATKVTGTSSDDAVKDLQVFVFDKNGVYETSSQGSGSSLSLTCTTGETTVVALVNAPQEVEVDNITELRSRTSDLKDCSPDAIVMAGELTQVLQASSSLTITVERLAAKVAVDQIRTDFELDQHKNLTFNVKAIYLVNVAGERAYLTGNTPSSWYNKGAYVAATSPSFLYDKVTSGVIADGASYNTRHHFYCYPNATATKTRLVVEAELGGYTYYYPVTLDKIDPNTSYTYSLTITRLGSDSPDKPVEDGTVQFSVVVKDWVEHDVDEII